MIEEFRVKFFNCMKFICIEFKFIEILTQGIWFYFDTICHKLTIVRLCSLFFPYMNILQILKYNLAIGRLAIQSTFLYRSKI